MFVEHNIKNGEDNEVLGGLWHTPVGLVRFYPNLYGLREIDGVLISSKSKSPPICINPPDPYGLKITEQARIGHNRDCAPTRGFAVYPMSRPSFK
jgi:hypothetical protein